MQEEWVIDGRELERVDPGWHWVIVTRRAQMVEMGKELHNPTGSWNVPDFEDFFDFDDVGV